MFLVLRDYGRLSPTKGLHRTAAYKNVMELTEELQTFFTNMLHSNSCSL